LIWLGPPGLHSIDVSGVPGLHSMTMPGDPGLQMMESGRPVMQ
jgi:hypothetical protein